ncbi:hypothetical protein H0H93_002426, partial [Arthromyces matolae]
NACKFTPMGGKLSIKTKLVVPANFSDITTSPVASSGSDLPYDNLESNDHPPLSTSHLTRHNNEGNIPGLNYIVVRIEITDTGVGIKHRDVIENKLF